MSALWLVLGPFRWWIAAGLIFAAVAGYIGVQHTEIAHLERDLQAEQTARLADRTMAAEAAASAAIAYRAREQSWAKSHEEIVNVAIQKTEAAASAVVAADAAAQRVSDRVATLAAAGRAAACHPAAASASAPAADPIGVLADLQRRADSRAGKLAEYADRARIAGEACVGAYESLSQ